MGGYPLINNPQNMFTDPHHHHQSSQPKTLLPKDHSHSLDLPKPSGYASNSYQKPTQFPLLLSQPIFQSPDTFGRSHSGWPQDKVSLPPLSHVFMSPQDSPAPIMSSRSPLAHIPSFGASLVDKEPKGLESHSACADRHMMANTTQTFSCMTLSSRRQGTKSKNVEEAELPRAKRPLLFVDEVRHPVISKPRWQDSERLGLLEAIVHDKALDDLSTFRWDWISLTVGKAKPACKEQWLCEVLPALLQKPSSLE
ncbi:hypothetical protein CLU79DRAFT_841775 [Phycomyces nitens]|nr:hypothetical protein CLU79DRAFT_841775 [Phycomyces nitens]